jgi:hypothetical protein
MILPVFQNTKYRLFLSHLCLSVALSSSFSSSLMASKNDLLGDNEEKILKRTRDTNNLNNTNIHNGEVDLTLEQERPLKNQKTEQASGAILKVTHEQGYQEAKNIWVYADVMARFFMSLSFKDIRSGRSVSKAWEQTLTHDDFCTYWGGHFFPSTPEAMGMRPQDFIRYWSTPSFKVLETGNQNIFISRPDTGIRSIRTCETGATICWERKDENNHRSTVVSWTSEGIKISPLLNTEDDFSPYSIGAHGKPAIGAVILETKPSYSVQPLAWSSEGMKFLPQMNNSQRSRPRDVSVDGSIIVGMAEDGANHGINKAVSWTSEGITLLPQFANKEDSMALGLNSNGSISVGMAFDGSKSRPVIWTSQGITALPDLNNEQNYRAYGVNADGSIIVGAEGTSELRKAVFWAAGKAFDLKKVLKEESIDFEWNVDLLAIYDITANGRQIVGFGEIGAHYDSSLKRMVSGYFFPFKAVLPPSFFER